MSRVKSEKRPSSPGTDRSKHLMILLMRPTCTVSPLWNGYDTGLELPKPRCRRTLEVQSVFCLFYLPVTWMIQEHQVNSIFIQLRMLFMCYKQGRVLLTSGNFRGWLCPGTVGETKMTKIWPRPSRNSDALMHNSNIRQRVMKWIGTAG